MCECLFDNILRKYQQVSDHVSGLSSIRGAFHCTFPLRETEHVSNFGGFTHKADLVKNDSKSLLVDTGAGDFILSSKVMIELLTLCITVEQMPRKSKIEPITNYKNSRINDRTKQSNQ